MGNNLPDERYLCLSRYENEALLDGHQICVLGPAEASILIRLKKIWSLFGDRERIDVVLDNPDVLPHNLPLLQVHRCPFTLSDNLQGVSLKN